MKRPDCSHIILYDGVCGLCNRLVGFVLERDRRELFCFAPLQGAFARELLPYSEGTPVDLDTLVVIAYYRTASEKHLTRSDAVLFVLEELGGVWRYSRILSLMPTTLLDTGYRWIAKTRYRFFGRYDSCSIPDPEYRSRFIEG